MFRLVLLCRIDSNGFLWTRRFWRIARHFGYFHSERHVVSFTLWDMR